MKALSALLLLLTLPLIGRAQTVYGKLVQELDSFETDHARFVKGGLVKLQGMSDSVRITSISTRQYAGRTIIAATVRKGRQIILDDGTVRFPVTPRSYSKVLYASDSTISPAALYKRCIRWMGKYYAAGTHVDVEDQASGIIVAKPTIKGLVYAGVAAMNDGAMGYTITIETRQGRIRIDQEHYWITTNAYLRTHQLNAEAKAPDGSGLQSLFSSADRTADADNAAIIAGLQDAIDAVEEDW